jgi:NAD(P)-dependent dehydrogenase (short-subunit alcohol dehydrogenase family)
MEGRNRAVILGAKPDSGNIGEAIADELDLWNWAVTMDDCLRGSPTRPKGAAQMHGDTAEEFGYEAGTYAFYDAPSYQEFQKWEADALIITLGTTGKTAFAEMKDYEMRRILRGCLELPLECARRFVQAAEHTHWQDRERSAALARHIIFVGSYAHDHPFTNGTAYCAAKAGLAMAARTLGWELTDMGYYVHVVHPYHVEGTPMWEVVQAGVMEARGWTREEADDYARKDLKMPDALTPREIGQVVRILVEELPMRWLSGQGLNLYGGSR